MTGALEMALSFACIAGAAFSVGILAGFSMGRYSGLKAVIEGAGIRILDGGRDE